MNDYEKDLEIDKYALDAECLDQAHKFAKWSEGLADAFSERDRMEQALNVTKAQVDKDIRTTPAQFGLEKVTETAVLNLVILDKRTQKAEADLIQANHTVGLYMTAKGAFEQRKSMIENLIKLFLSGYWSDPKVEKKSKEEMTGKATEEQKKALSSSKRLSEKKK